jgi:uncharacterized Ntn-hydrolase superfamily protein
MTFSLVARCPRTGQFGLAAATAIPAVGKLLTHAAPGVGAVATQAKLNPYIGIDGLRYLSMGLSASEVRDRLLGEDPLIENRQFAIVDRLGGTAVFTGARCLDWAGSLVGDGFSVQGNRLAGGDVLERAAKRFNSLSDLPLADRLLEALAAGDAAGGDLEGEVSATIYVIDREEYPLWDIRVDEHARPITELRRLHGIFREQLLPEILTMPTRANPAGRPEEHPV